MKVSESVPVVPAVARPWVNIEANSDRVRSETSSEHVRRLSLDKPDPSFRVKFVNPQLFKSAPVASRPDSVVPLPLWAKPI